MNLVRQFLMIICFVFGAFPLSGFGFSLPDLLNSDRNNGDGKRIDGNSEKQYESRIESWKTLIKESNNDSDWQKLNKVNQFFNRVNYASDKDQWGVDDYWATPREFLKHNAGDCEDYSIAKYFTLKAMGVSVDRLRITYVTSLPLKQAHMVLVYLEGSKKTPLVLDNLKQSIEPFSARMDLDPVYSFNNNGLWLAGRETAKDELVGGTNQVGPWQMLSVKVSEERFM